MINVLKRFYIVCVSLLILSCIAVAVSARPDEQSLALFNALVSVPLGAYIFYRTVRFVFYGK